mgnify:CR=1 FL=1
MQMDAIIREIITIDKKAKEIEDNANERIKISEDETKSQIEAMKAEIIRNAKNEANELYQKAIDEAKALEQKSKIESDDKLYKLEKKFNDIKEGLEDKIFAELLNLWMGNDDEE